MRDGTVTVTLDGQALVKLKMAEPRPARFIRLQKKAELISFRNIKVRKLD